MAGNHRSGRPRTRQRLEEARRIDALDFARENGLPTVQRETPGGEVFEMGTCPSCTQPRRHLFETSAGTVCRRCAGLSYRSSSESNSIAQIVRRDPTAAAGEALQTMQNALENGNAAELDKSAHVLEIAATMPSATASAPSNHAAPDFGRVQEVVIEEDLARSSALIEQLFDELMSREETRVDKRGNVEKIPMRPDSQARLLGAFVSVSNMRANRAGIATHIHAAQQTRPDSLREQMLSVMKERGHRSAEGRTLEEIEAIQRGE